MTFAADTAGINPAALKDKPGGSLNDDIDARLTDAPFRSVLDVPASTMSAYPHILAPSASIMALHKLVWIVAVLAGVALFSTVRAADNWPKFRGPDGTSVSENENLPDEWSATENIEWQVEVPGRGWSSPIVWGNRIFLTTAVNAGETPEAKKGLYFRGEQHEPPDSVHAWKILCLDLESGKLLWEKTAHEGKPATTLHIKNSYASETPVTDGRRVYAYFGNVGVFCYDLEGNLVWSKRLEPHATRSGWGPAASPALFGNKLYIVNDNDESSYLLALDAKTGDEVWRIERDERSNWSTPFVWQNDLRTELVTAGTTRARSYDLDGNALWSFEGMSIITIGTPFASGGLLYVSSGYVLDLKRPIYAIRPGGQGDITLPANKDTSPAIAWCQRTGAPYNPSPLAYRDRLYVLYDKGLFACFDAQSGDVIYNRQRIPDGRAFTASPWACGGKVFCLSEYGQTLVIEAGDEFKILRTNALADDEMCMATPALVGDRLLIRSAERLYSIRKKQKE
jgi:outer membrane protein assembly factor BamB